MKIKWTQDKKVFYKYACQIALPIAVQNLISALVNSVDVVMLGYVSQDALSASSLANQLQFVLTCVFGGLGAGMSVMVAQYWGKDDYKTIEDVMGLALRFFAIVGLLFAGLAFFFPSLIMKLFTNEQSLIQLGTDYLRIIAFSYIFMGFSSFYLSAMRSMERVILSTSVYVVSLMVNIIINATFIFGLFGAPKLGLVGVAIGTVTARFVEVLICIADNMRKRKVNFHLRSVLGHKKALMGDFLKLAIPSTMNDLIWSLGFSMYSVIMGHMGTDAVAANSVAAVVRNLATVFCLGFANATSIVLGKAMGGGDLEQAWVYSKRMVLLTVITSLVSGVIIVIGSPLIITTIGRDLSTTAQGYLKAMIFINSYYALGVGLNTCWICGCFRAGGDTKFGFILDTFAMWAWSVPLGFVAAFLLKLPVIAVYFILCTDEFCKMPIVIHHFRKKVWLKNITRDRNEIAE